MRRQIFITAFAGICLLGMTAYQKQSPVETASIKPASPAVIQLADARTASTSDLDSIPPGPHEFRATY